MAPETNTLINTQIAATGIQLLTSSTAAVALADIIINTTALATQLINDELTPEAFSEQADVATKAAVSGGLNDSIALLTAATGASGSSDNSGSGTSTVSDDDSSGSGTSAGSDDDSSGSGASTEVPNYAPVILNVGVCSTAKENIVVVCDLMGTDGNGDELTFSVTGTDAADFTVASNSVLKFAVNPDYENPADANTNNEYEITLRVSDGTVTTTRDLKLQVLNVEENQLGEGSFGTSVTE